MKPRLRDLGASIGTLSPGPGNAITDVPGVWVGQTTLVLEEPRIARTGVTAIVPQEGLIWKEQLFAGTHSYNGCGEMTGTHWIAESGLLSTPILITNTAQVGTAHEALGAYYVDKGVADDFELPVVAETWDGWLNDMTAQHLRPEHVYAALDTAGPGVVEEGCTGGGTGMICHEFKGGTGTASRALEIHGERYAVGALVQANYGRREDLRLDGIPIGLEVGYDRAPSAWEERPGEGSIIVVIATDAPLLAHQSRRLAQRGAAGLARAGGLGYNGSGDLMLAFSTGNVVDQKRRKPHAVQMLPNESMNGLFKGAIEAVEEAIWNALIGAVTTAGFKGRVAPAIPHEEVVRVWRKYRE